MSCSLGHEPGSGQPPLTGPALALTGLLFELGSGSRSSFIDLSHVDPIWTQSTQLRSIPSKPTRLYALLSALYPDVFTAPEPFDSAFDLAHGRVDDAKLAAAHYLLRPFCLRRWVALMSDWGVSRMRCVWRSCSFPSLHESNDNTQPTT